MNNHDKPVDLREKIEYLHEKIDHLQGQINKSGLFELKMKFIDFIDNTIERLYALENKKPYSSQKIQKKYEQYYKAEENEKQKARLNSQSQVMSQRLLELAEKQKQIELQSLRIELENSRIVKHKILKEADLKETEMKQYIFDLQKKQKGQEKEIVRLVNLNAAQGRQIDTLKEERNKAEKRELDWKERYQSQIGLLETFNENKAKYIYRNQEGLQVLRTVTNITNQKKGCERLFLCDLPLKFHIIKISYGIKVGVLQPNRNIVYFQEISLYEKEDMIFTLNQGQLSLTYIKRKVNIKLEKYKIPNDQIVIMLFGKGDSIAIDESQ